MSFSKDIKKFAAKTNKALSGVIVASIFDLNNTIIKGTPVDTGRARGGWIPSLNSASFAGGKTDKTGNATVAKANSVALTAPGNVYFLVNSVAYIRQLEFGLYPKNQQKGKYNKKNKSYEIRTVGGYSKLAPQGMVRVAVTEFKNDLREAVQNVN